MGDWEFLYEMKDQGYSEEAIEEAMSSGAAPWEWDQIEKQERKNEWEKLKALRDTGAISREEFKKRKAEIFN
jgi:multidrug resistance efflux pump